MTDRPNGKDDPLAKESKRGRELAEQLVDHMKKMGGAERCWIPVAGYTVEVAVLPADTQDVSHD